MRQLARQIEQEKMNFFRSNPNQRINQPKVTLISNNRSTNIAILQ